jgi:hypothetical protein
VKLGAAKYEGWKRMAEKEAARVKDFVDRKDRHDEEVRLKVIDVESVNIGVGVEGLGSTGNLNFVGENHDIKQPGENHNLQITRLSAPMHLLAKHIAGYTFIHARIRREYMVGSSGEGANKMLGIFHTTAEPSRLAVRYLPLATLNARAPCYRKVLRVALRPEVALSCEMSHPAGYLGGICFLTDEAGKFPEPKNQEPKEWGGEIRIFGEMSHSL